MKSMKKRIGAILLSALMVLSVIGVQPTTEVSATAGSTVTSGNFGGGSTNVHLSYGIRFLLVNYDKYQCWKSTKSGALDLNTTSAKNAIMKSDIKSDDYLGDLNYSHNAIYVGMSSASKDIVVTDGSKNSFRKKTVRSYKWSSIGKIVKAMAPTAASKSEVKKAFETLSKNQSSASAWSSAFNKLEKALLQTSTYDQAQANLRKAFRNYNAMEKDTTLFDNNIQYYLIVEPVVYLTRGSACCAVSTQDLYGVLSARAGDGGSSLISYGGHDTSFKKFVENLNGITLAAGRATKLRNLSTILYQKSFKYSKKRSISAKGNAVSKTRTLKHGNKFTFYYRGGYAAIVPINNSPDEDSSVQVYQYSTYSGSVGDSGNKNLSGTTGGVISTDSVDSISVSNDSNSDYYLLSTGSYLLNADDESKVTKADLTSMASSFRTNTNSTKVSINWVSDSIGGTSVGRTWGTNGSSSITSNGGDYIKATTNSSNKVVFIGSEYLADESEVTEESSGVDDPNDTSSAVDDSDYDDSNDTDEADDSEEDEDDGSDSDTIMNEYNVTDSVLSGLSASYSNYGYAYGNTGSKWLINSASMKTKLKDALKYAWNGANESFKASTSKLINIEKRSGTNYVTNYVPFTAGVIVKKSTITSNVYQLTYDTSTKKLKNGKVKAKIANGSYGSWSTSGASCSYKTFNGSSSTANYGKVKGDANSFYVVAIPKSVISSETNALNYVKTKLGGSGTIESDAFINAVENLSSDSTFELKKEIEGGDVIKVGACQKTDGTGLAGYTVVFIGIDGDIPLTGEEVLESYQLNSIDSNITSTFANQHNNASLVFHTRKSSTYVYNNNTKTVSCSTCNLSWSPCLKELKKSTNMNYYDRCSEESGSKYVIAKDGLNSSNGKYLIKTSYGNYSGYGSLTATRNTLIGTGETIDSSTNVQFSYAYNLVRSIWETKTASSLTADNGNATDVTGVLEMSYGNVPAGEVDASAKRDSSALVGSKLTETIKWIGRYSTTTQKDGHGLKRLADYTATTHTGTNADGSTHTLSFNLVQDDDWSDALKPFKLANIPMQNARVVVTESAKKYQTDTIATGTNSKTDGIIKTSISSMKATDTNKDSILDNDTRYAYLEKHDVSGDDIELKFYPEVKMLMYGLVDSSAGITSTQSVYRKTLYTMGEKKRTAKSSSLYLYRVSSAKTADGVSQKLTGKVYSDDMTTTSQGVNSDNLPVIYAGGNVSLKVEGANLNLNLYGYSVDLVNKDKDSSGFKINDTETLTYKSIVDDETDIYDAWGNSDANGIDANESTQKLFTDYKAWVRNMANADNYGADVTLEVTDTTVAGGVKSYNNFSTTIGKIAYDEATQTKEEGVYPIAVYNGKVVTAKDTPEEQKLSKGYWNLVAQIEKDYNCDEATAIQTLEDSGMFESIYSAIESSTSDFNKSGKATSIGALGGSDVTTELGNENNWYDEVVKTFCIRRYVTDTLHIEGTVLSDKVDYDAAPSDNSTGSGINDTQSTYNKSNASWYVSFYFKNNPNNGEVGALTAENKKLYQGTESSLFYNPALADSASSFTNATSNYTTLTDKLHIDGADFVIPSSATTDEAN